MKVHQVDLLAELKRDGESEADWLDRVHRTVEDRIEAQGQIFIKCGYGLSELMLVTDRRNGPYLSIVVVPRSVFNGQSVSLEHWTKRALADIARRHGVS